MTGDKNSDFILIKIKGGRQSKAFDKSIIMATFSSMSFSLIFRNF
jgi:hypothetical protein